MAFSLFWRGDYYRDLIRAEAERRLDDSAMLVLNRVRVLLSTPIKGGRDIHGRLIKSGPSRPGEPPRLRTGRLRSSYGWERSGLTVRIGSEYNVARFLEFGTSRILPRPHLRRALLETTPAIRSLWAKRLQLP